MSKFKKGDVIKHRGNRWLYIIVDTCRVYPPDNGTSFYAYILSRHGGQLFVQDEKEIEDRCILRKRLKLILVKRK